MARKYEEVTIEGVEGTFIITQLSPTKAYWLALDLAALVAPSAAMGLGGKQGLDIRKLDLAQLGLALESLFSRANREELKRIQKELFDTVEHVGTQKKSVNAAIDFIFAGKPFGIPLLLKETLRVNYQDFFDALSEKLRPLIERAMQQKVQAESKTSTISPGPSGDSLPSE